MGMVGAKKNIMDLKLELTRLIEASNKVLYQYKEQQVQRYSDSSREDFKLSIYDLRKAKKRAEDALKNKQTELFT